MSNSCKSMRAWDIICPIMSVSRFDWRNKEHYFLPHHVVFKSPGGKIRVVFDGSAKTSSGASLNECLHSGPNLQRDIGDLLTEFRRHQVVFVADIRMMFRQTVIHPSDRKYQLILWREHPEDPILTYELNTNTYGLKSSPFVAIRSLLELAEQEYLPSFRKTCMWMTSALVPRVLQRL